MKTIPLLVVFVTTLIGANFNQAAAEEELLKNLQGKWVTEDKDTTSSMSFTNRQFELSTREKKGENREAVLIRGTIEISSYRGLWFLTMQITDLKTYGTQTDVRGEVPPHLFVIKNGKLYMASGFVDSERVPFPTMEVWERPKPKN
jgi:hypothetical protein